MTTNVKRALITVLLLAMGFAGGWYVCTRSQQEDMDEREYEIRQQGYRYINPLLECEMARERIGVLELTPFRSELEKLVKGLEDGKQVFTVSVYFRDLNNGPWFGVNYAAEFSPASLLKVPVMIACLKQAESNPGFLKQKVGYKGGGDENEGEYFKPPRTLMPGSQYTIEQLIERSILYSDNNANALLLRNLDVGILARVYSDLGISLPGPEKSEDFMTIKAYASFFRVLFNASYLGRDMSERALISLCRSEFKSGLVAGVPGNISVAHKFGERTLGPKGDVKQLHDCGIIYQPDHPYLLCVMTRGRSFESLDDAIRNVSSFVYTRVSKQFMSTP